MRLLKPQSRVSGFEMVLGDERLMYGLECMIPLVMGCKQVVLVGDHQVGTPVL